jgi:recombination protein RecA
MVNIVGDKSTGKTLLAIEAAANFYNEHPEAQLVYAETEAAFDPGYAESLGMPVEAIEFPEIYTVEDLFKDIESRIEEKGDIPMLYIVDSLDALSDQAEQKLDIAEGTYGTQKAKQLSKLFRKLIKKIKSSNTTLMIVSQIRDKLDAVAFGKKHVRSGGRAMDFYASQVLWLAHVGYLQKQRKGVKRPIGITVKGKAEKNKVGPPFRECSFPLIFGYGVEDLPASLEWLVDVGRWDMLGMTKEETSKAAKNYATMDQAQYDELLLKSTAAVKEAWADIERDFLPTRKKY